MDTLRSRPSAVNANDTSVLDWRFRDMLSLFVREKLAIPIVELITGSVNVIRRELESKSRTKDSMFGPVVSLV